MSIVQGPDESGSTPPECELQGLRHMVDFLSIRLVRYSGGGGFDSVYWHFVFDYTAVSQAGMLSVDKVAVYDSFVELLDKRACT